MARYRDLIGKAADPWRLRREVAEFALEHGVDAAARKFGATPRTVNRLLERAKQGSLDAPVRRSTGRYRDLVETSPDPWRVRRDMVAFALKHGVEAASREFGAGPTTVRTWLRRAKEGPWKKPGSQGRRLSLAQVERIVRAKLQRPDLSARGPKEEFGIPHGLSKMKEVLRTYGLARSFHPRNLEFEVRSAERRSKLAEMYLELGKIEKAHGMKTPRGWDPMSALRRSIMLDLALMKKRARLARSIEKKRKKKGGRSPSAGSGQGGA